MNIVITKNSCTGCGVCSLMCPRQAIVMQINCRGFYEPIINRKLCVKCKLCINVCPQNRVLNRNEFISGKSFQLNKKEILYKSSSGGATYALCSFLIEQGYIIIGSNFEVNSLEAKHIEIKTKDDIQKIQGSKYIQSKISPSNIKINPNNKYAFFGLPCQIAGFSNYLKIKHLPAQNFVLIELFCFGVPSRNLLTSFLKKTKIRSITSLNFRSKKFGWHNYTMEIESNGCNYYFDQRKDNCEFFLLFKSRICLNEACYHCNHFNYLYSSADIKIGDLWGQKQKDNRDGISFCVSYTATGETLLKKMQCHNLSKHDLDDALNAQYNRKTNIGCNGSNLYSLLLLIFNIKIIFFLYLILNKIKALLYKVKARLLNK